MRWLKYLRLGLGGGSGADEVVTGYRKPLGYVQILNATLAASTGIVMPVPIPSYVPGYVIIQCQGGVVRWRDDGVAPTATVGMSLPSGAELDYPGDISAIRFISSSGTPILDISLYA